MVLFYTHLLLGITAFLLLKDYFPGGNETIFFLLVLLGSILPDIDEADSKINRWSGLAGGIIAFFSRHRGFFHSLLFFALSALLIRYFWSGSYAAGLFMGFMAHLAGDAITKMGVAAFYPISEFKIKGPVKVGGIMEMILVLFLAGIIIKIVL